jgi:hypothetical protein
MVLRNGAGRSTLAEGRLPSRRLTLTVANIYGIFPDVTET